MEILELLRKTGALVESDSGHFVDSNGLHSSQLLRVEKVLQFAPFNRKLSYEIVRHFLELDIHVVAAPSVGAIPAAVEVGRQLEARTIFIDPRDETRLYEGFMMYAGERVVIVQDLLRSDKELDALAAIVRDTDARLIGVGSIIDVRPSRRKFTVKDVSAMRIQLELHEAGSCPLCSAGSPIIRI